MKTKIPKNELINNAAIRCYDNGGKTADRYTVIYIDERENQPGTFAAVGMSASPFHPQGIGMHVSAMPGKHLGRRIAFADLPEDCRKLVQQDTRPPEITPFLRGYLLCALWTNGDQGEDAHGKSVTDMASCALRRAAADCERFQRDNADALTAAEMSNERAGHCLWLNRNGHGSGFWDEYSQTTCDAYAREQAVAMGTRDFSKRDAVKQSCPCKYHACERLSDAARALGTVDLYAGDDGRLFFS